MLFAGSPPFCQLFYWLLDYGMLPFCQVKRGFMHLRFCWVYLVQSQCKKISGMGRRQIKSVKQFQLAFEATHHSFYQLQVITWQLLLSPPVTWYPFITMPGILPMSICPMGSAARPVPIPFMPLIPATRPHPVTGNPYMITAGRSWPEVNYFVWPLTHHIGGCAGGK